MCWRRTASDPADNRSGSSVWPVTCRNPSSATFERSDEWCLRYTSHREGRGRPIAKARSAGKPENRHPGEGRGFGGGGRIGGETRGHDFERIRLLLKIRGQRQFRIGE